jgi:phosphate acyltransferase
LRWIAFDAMGSDGAPGFELDAVALALRDPNDAAQQIGIILVGDEKVLAAGLQARGLKPGPRLALRHASQVITMDDHPSAAVKGKKDSSMRVAFELVKKGEAAAVVSAGNSGGMMACGLFVLRRLPGALRPGIVTTFPTLKGECALCDMGANVDPKPEVMAQFGMLGAAYAQVVLGKTRPRVGLLSNGEEEHKGTELTREAHKILKGLGPDCGFQYVGYVEGKDIFSGDIDVVATDGFTGNVVLKTAEGAAAALLEMLRAAFMSTARSKLAAVLARPALRAWKKRIDYAETGGAPLLGVNGLALISHGRSSPEALKNALFTAARFAERGLVEHVAKALSTQPAWQQVTDEAKSEQEA